MAESSSEPGAFDISEVFEASFCHGRPLGEVGNSGAEMLKGVAAGRAEWDFDVLANCRDEVLAVYENADSPFPAIVPRLTAGEVCHANGECIDGSCSGTCPGLCVDLRGQPCVGSSECGVLSCTAAGCGDAPGAGEPCIDECAPGLRCDGTCQPLSGNGGPCVRDQHCTDGHFCSSMTCTPLLGAGQTCRDISECARGLNCVGGTCVAGRTAGTGCVSTAQCAPGMHCVDALCRPVQTQGEPCDETNTCAFGLSCSDARCRTLPTLGESCDAEVGCLRGVCVDGTCQDAPVDSTCESDWKDQLFVEALEPCGESGSCVEISNEFFCRPAHAVGETCQPDDSCAYGLVCGTTECEPWPECP